jgi:argininosuccinate lyase
MESKVNPRLAEAVALEVCENIYGPRLARDFGVVFDYMTDANQAHLLMLLKQQLISPQAAQAIAKGMLQMKEEGASVVDLDPQREDSYFNYEAHLIGLVGMDAGGRLHTARSRNDLNCAIDRLRARNLLLDISETLAQIQEHALDCALCFRDAIMPGYTHLQHAQPTTYGFYLVGIANAFGRDVDRLLGAWSRVNLSPLGAGALAGTPFNIDRHFLAAALGFEGLVDNALDAVASRDFGLEILGYLSQLAVGWSRVAQDYYVMVSQEFQTIEFPDRVTGTSSIMPQKKNPVVLEHLKGKAGNILGSYVAAAVSLKGTNFTNTIDGNRGSMAAVWEAGEEVERCLPLLDLIVSTARPNRDLMAQRVLEGFSTATDLADALVRDHSLSFRQAHHVVGGIVRTALDRKLMVQDITGAMLDDTATEQIGHPIGLSNAQVQSHLDPAASIASRSLPGGPAPVAVERSVELARDQLSRHRAQIALHRAGIAASSRKLHSDIAALVAS